MSFGFVQVNAFQDFLLQICSTDSSDEDDVIRFESSCKFKCKMICTSRRSRVCGLDQFQFNREVNFFVPNFPLQNDISTNKFVADRKHIDHL